MIGGTLGPDVAYRVSRGEVVTSHLGWKVKLIRPLDFVVVADHAENLGLADFIRRSDPIILANETGKKWHDLVKAGKGYDAFIEWLRAENNDLINEPRMMQAVWAKVVKNADEYYQPGIFTTFPAFEWTSHAGGNNLHRVVIFRDRADKTSQVLPFSQYDSVDPEDLWDYLANYEKKTGGRVLSIAHNGNFSNGLMFDTKTLDGNPLTNAYAEQRMRFEPLYEVTQQKGDTEAHPLLSPDDEFADFETMDKGNLNGTVAKTQDMLPKEYAREALKEGLRLEEKLGTNPFKFGMVGSTDNHGDLHERIYDVAVSDDRKIGADGRCKTPVGNTVDVEDASYTNTIGDPLLVAYWVDPAFDPEERAVYYIRVIEIPTARWTAYDAKLFNVKMPEGTKMQLQDRAYTSPIWYTP